MGTIRGIILDKDGTLFDYGEVWGPVLSEAIEKGMKKLRVPDEKREQCIDDFCRTVGVDRAGRTYPDGIIFSHDKLFRATLRILGLTFRYHLSPWMVWKIVKRILTHEDLRLSEHLAGMDFTDVCRTVKALAERGYILGIVTTDTENSTSLFLSRMGIAEYISFLRTKDSATHPKPNPEAIREFCKEYNLESSEVAVIGDTVVDMEFGVLGKVGYKVAVLTGSGDKERLTEEADVVYPSLKDIISDPILFP